MYIQALESGALRITLKSWRELCNDAIWRAEINFSAFVRRLPYFRPVEVKDLKVGDRVVCIAKENQHALRMSDLSQIQAWDVPVVRVTDSSVNVGWVSGERPLKWFRDLVFKTPYIVSLPKKVKNIAMGRRWDDFTNSGYRLKYRCRFDDFLPNPAIRELVYDQIVNSNVPSVNKIILAVDQAKQSDIYFERLQRNCGKQEWKLIVQRIITAHCPNSILGQLLKEGRTKKIRFVLKHFCVDKKILNGISIGPNYLHPTEILIQNRHSKLLSWLVKKHKLILFGKKLSFGGKWCRHFSAVLSALEVGDPLILQDLKTVAPTDSFEVMLSFPDEQGRTPLSLAVVNQRAEYVETLLEVKASVDQSSWGGDTALAIGYQFGICQSIMKMLLEAGANIDRRDSTGVAPKARKFFQNISKPSL